MRVTADTFEYADWPSRKPSKKKLQRESLKRDPLGTVGQVGVTTAKRAAEKSAERVARDVTRAVSRSVGVGGILAGARAASVGVAVAAAPAAIAGAGLTLAIALGTALKNQARVRTGDAINKLSLQFVENQKALMRATRAPTWNDVPREARARLLRDYKSAVATAAAQGGFTRSVEGYK